jgi:hypothetical protein
MQSGQEKKDPDAKPTSGDPTATLVLGLLEMKGGKIFSKSPGDKINYMSVPFVRLRK